jgi:hypothetical protein
VHQFQAVVAACLVLAYEDVSATMDLSSKVGCTSMTPNAHNASDLVMTITVLFIVQIAYVCWGGVYEM